MKHDVTVDDDSASSPSSDSTKRRYNADDVVAGKYQLIRILGEGGMGAVWEARNIGLDSAVAIKLIRADLDEDSAAERLVQEARAAARLGHPAIVRVFDVGETHFGDPFIVMERLRGDNMGDLLGTEGRLTAVAAVQILLPIADALATAHTKGIVHRDIKPENIYLAEDENGELQPKLVDFGVAKLENAEVDSKLTLRGTIVGSPGYLAPEQARGSEAADYRVDIWAFSVVLYELITGVPPFSGGNYNALLRSIVEDDPTPTVEHRAGDAELWTIVERGLRKDAQERWPSMQEYGRALAHWAFSQGVDEDICGTGLEAKWLTGKAPGRASLVSVNFEEFESPSAIRQRRRLRSDSPVARSASTAATQAPPPPHPPPAGTLLPSPAALLAEERMYAVTELDGVPAEPNRKKVVLVTGAALGLLFIVGLAFVLIDSKEPPATSGPPVPATVAADLAAAAANAATADTPEGPPPRTTAPDVSGPVAPQAIDGVATETSESQPANPVQATRSKPPTSSVVQRKAPRKEAEKPLTQQPDTPKLDLKKPY
ncbi:MAG TPA: protein kinase [Polyangiaceae bacterium]|nr:protein kinase [Polyangiaceae bacterium]